MQRDKHVFLGTSYIHILGTCSMGFATWIISTTQKFEPILIVHINIHIANMKFFSSEQHIVRHYINDNISMTS